MYLKRHAQSSMLSSCPIAIWRKSYSSNLCSKYHASETFFFGLKMQNSPCPGRGHPLPDPPPLGRFAHSQFSTQLTFGGFRRHGINFFSYMSKISIWYFLIHDELLENCYEKIDIKVFKIRLILHYRASRIPELPGPLSGPWTPAAIQGICFSPRGVDPGGLGAGGQPSPNENIGGQTYRFAPPPQ